MALQTYSSFYYDLVVTTSNGYINFDEGGGELSAQVTAGTYTLSTILTAIKTAMDSTGGLVYTVTVDRDTRLISIASTATFDLLLSTGTQVGQSIWGLIGYNQGVDLTGLTIYTGDTGAAKEYLPQFVLQDYVDFEDNQESVQASVNESASGTVEVVKFGTRKFADFNLSYIHDTDPDYPNGGVILDNANGIADARDFMEYLITKGQFEFMPNVGNKNIFVKAILERTATSSDGTGFQLKELYNKGLVGIFETGKLKIRLQE